MMILKSEERNQKISLTHLRPPMKTMKKKDRLMGTMIATAKTTKGNTTVMMKRKVATPTMTMTTLKSLIKAVPHNELSLYL